MFFFNAILGQHCKQPLLQQGRGSVFLSTTEVLGRRGIKWATRNQSYNDRFRLLAVEPDADTYKDIMLDYVDVDSLQNQ